MAHLMPDRVFFFPAGAFCRIAPDFFSTFTAPKRQRHVLSLSTLTRTLTLESTMKLSFGLKNRWRATTALCVVSTLAIVTASYAAEWGRSNWDKRKHDHHHQGGQGNGNNNGHDNHDNGNNNGMATAITTTQAPKARSSTSSS
jgi:hypothetical protein